MRFTPLGSEENIEGHQSSLHSPTEQLSTQLPPHPASFDDHNPAAIIWNLETSVLKEWSDIYRDVIEK
jgi:hypothetical protein